MNKSETIASLAGALSKAQAEIRGAAKLSENPFFHSNYADLASVWDACREALTNNGLSVVQTTEPAVDADTNGFNHSVFVETVLMHESGEWISGRLRVTPVKDDPQGLGSAITYGRRYGLAAIVGVAPEDDDGNAASQPAPKSATKPQTTTNTRRVSKRSTVAAAADTSRQTLMQSAIDCCRLLNERKDSIAWSTKTLNHFSVEHFHTEIGDLNKSQLNELLKLLSDRHDGLKIGDDARRHQLIEAIRENNAPEEIAKALADTYQGETLEGLSLAALTALADDMVPF